MFCSKCGLQLPDDANVCYKCATPTKHSPSQPAAAVRPIVIKQSGGGMAAAAFALILIILIGGAALGFLAYKRYRDQQNILEVDRNGDLKINIPTSGVPAPKLPPVKSSETNRTAPRPAAKTYACTILGKSNVRMDCNTKNCDEDDSTVYGTIDNGDAVTLIDGLGIQSANGYTWEVIRDDTGQTYYISSKKLACERGE